MTHPICVALDTPDVTRARDLARLLKGHVGYLKIGMEFFYANGVAGYETVASEGLPVFLDLKLHDIPNTVAQGLTSLLKLAPAPAIVNVHAQGGLDMMKAASDAVAGRCKLIAVTILTSLSNEDIWATGLNDDLATDDHALNLASLAHEAGLDGVVCSPLDLIRIRSTLPEAFMTVVPGIRPAATVTHDQKRVATPRSALDAGADILVIGRAITGADDPVAACRNIKRELE
jgi:orotidine-5'-phosphate decarboxylase